jgi:hypothetical protein
MNKTFTIGAALVSLCIGFQSAHASLLGMPLNLKPTAAQADPDRPASPAIFRGPFFLFYAGDMLTVPPNVSSC